MSHSFHTVDFSTRGYDVTPLLACPAPEGACTIYDLKLVCGMAPMTPDGIAASRRSGVWIYDASNGGGGRYTGFAKHMDGLWYAFDVCHVVHRAPAWDTSDRMTSSEAMGLVYVRQDCLVPATLVPSS